jgi:hypothetical protein
VAGAVHVTVADSTPGVIVVITGIPGGPTNVAADAVLVAPPEAAAPVSRSSPYAVTVNV